MIPVTRGHPLDRQGPDLFRSGACRPAVGRRRQGSRSDSAVPGTWAGWWLSGTAGWHHPGLRRRPEWRPGDPREPGSVWIPLRDQSGASARHFLGVRPRFDSGVPTTGAFDDLHVSRPRSKPPLVRLTWRRTLQSFYCLIWGHPPYQHTKSHRWIQAEQGRSMARGQCRRTGRPAGTRGSAGRSRGRRARRPRARRGCRCE